MSRFFPNGNLGVVMHASDGQALVGGSRVPVQRVVIDCGFTRYRHGRSRLYRYVAGTADAVDSS